MYWDNTNLYIGVKVLDATIITNHTNRYDNDAVEIYFDMNNNGGVYDASDRQFIYVVTENIIWETGGRNAGVTFGSKIIPGGYTMEFAIPWTTLGVTPSTAALYGFDIAIDDADLANTNVRDNQVMWVGDGNDWQSTANFGHLKLLTQTNTTISQTIALEPGWNLISFNVTPVDKTFTNIFQLILPNVLQIKNNDGYWLNGQDAQFNSLSSISEGAGYLINMKAAGTVTISGTQSPAVLKTMIPGWNLIGCPYQTPTLLNSLFNITTTETIKNFTGFWMPNGGALNSITNLEPGKGYYVRLK